MNRPCDFQTTKQLPDRVSPQTIKMIDELKAQILIGFVNADGSALTPAVSNLIPPSCCPAGGPRPHYYDSLRRSDAIKTLERMVVISFDSGKVARQNLGEIPSIILNLPSGSYFTEGI